MGRIYRAIKLVNNGKSTIIVAFVDSGADRTIISGRVAKQLGIKTLDKEKLIVANRDVIIADIGKVRVVSERDNIDDIIYVDITDVPFDMDIDDVDMIIGIDFLQKHNVKLSFRKLKAVG